LYRPDDAYHGDCRVELGWHGVLLVFGAPCVETLAARRKPCVRLVNKAFLEALAKDFREGGTQAIAEVRKHQPAAYMKICALLVPREMKVQHSQILKNMSDDELDEAIAAVPEMLDQGRRRAEWSSRALRKLSRCRRQPRLSRPSASGLTGCWSTRTRRLVRVSAASASLSSSSKCL
jgi:hypothetical protein